MEEYRSNSHPGNEITDSANLHALASAITDPYFNTIVSTVNDHVVRMGIMTGPYRWHSHPNSDETFIGLEGTVIIETRTERYELRPGATVTIPKNIEHRTLPKGERSVNLTIEFGNMETVFHDK